MSVDRLESRSTLIQLSQSHELVILDRYVASNLAHQGARVSPGGRDDFLSWLARLEYEMFGLPRADLTIYLDMPAEKALQLIYKKKQRSYTTEVADIYERDLDHLILCREVYQELANRNFHSKWLSIQCTDRDSHVLEASGIHESVCGAIRQVIDLPGVSDG